MNGFPARPEGPWDEGEALALSAVLFGAHRVTGNVKTTHFAKNKVIPKEPGPAGAAAPTTKLEQIIVDWDSYLHGGGHVARDH